MIETPSSPLTTPLTAQPIAQGDHVSIILPTKNEQHALAHVLTAIQNTVPKAEILVVDDGSTDASAQIARDCGVRVIRHPYSLGNGAAIKTGVRAARGEYIVCMDADGQHDPTDIPRLLQPLIEDGYMMVVGARDRTSQASFARFIANAFYNRLASLITKQTILDLTSGFRAAHTHAFRQFLYLLPNEFSYPSTITMAFFRCGYAVRYIPIRTAPRQGRSHIQPLRDGLRFLLIIFKIATLYSPLRLFFPVSLMLFTTGIGYYLWTYLTMARFTNMGALLLTAAIIVFMLGLVSEQITALNYRDSSS
jgi:glycosyltransferase involved in cell wall biosynthesis